MQFFLYFCAKIMQFKDVIGQEAAKQTLRKAVKSGRIPHAQLFMGKGGVGKLPLALAYAQYLACEHRTDEDSCGVCPSCLQFSKMQHPDLHFAFPIVKPDSGSNKEVVCDDFLSTFIEKVSKNPYISFAEWSKELSSNKQPSIYEKESSEILRKLSLKAYSGEYKIMIIWQADRMNKDCSNKILKILEEPYDKTIFLLTTENPELLLPTIVSRTQSIWFPPLSEQELETAILQRYPEVSPEQAHDIAHVSGGSLHLANNKLNKQDKKNKKGKKEEKEEPDEQTRNFTLFQTLMQNVYTMITSCDQQEKADALIALRTWSLTMTETKTMGREQQKSFLQYAQRQIRENFIYNFGLPQLNYQTAEERAISAKIAPFFNQYNVPLVMNDFEEAEKQIAQNANAKIVFFDICLNMIVQLRKTK